MSVREFAAHLGVNDAAVSNWERRGDQARLRYQTQQLLDTDLARAPQDVRDRFERALAAETPIPDPQLETESPDSPEAPASVTGAAILGSGSAARTRVLLDTMQSQIDAGLWYLPPTGAADQLTQFLASAFRVYLVKGPPGCGKTRMTYHLADELADAADVQLLSVDSWEPERLDLAAEVLRYASLARGDDALLTLERECAALSRPCLVIVDGIKTRELFHEVSRHVDGILRQVTSGTLRFMLVVRTPPEVEVAAHPVLAASIFEPAGPRQAGTSFVLTAWTHAQARLVWNRSRTAHLPDFDDLPIPIQQLTRLPLYMQLVRTAGHDDSPTDVNAYNLIDQCVRTILRGAGQDVGQAVQNLSDLALRQVPELVPPGLLSLVESSSVGEPGPEDVGAVPVLVRVSPAGVPTFAHDLLREYFLSTRIADALRARGRSVATVGAFNDLAEKATTSAIARNIFELAVFCLDGSARSILSTVAMSPTVSIGTTLPLMLRLVADGAEFATTEVLRTCARRCDHDSAQELARALLAVPTILIALGEEHASWFHGLLRRFGSSIWTDAMRFVEQTLDAHTAHRLLESADLGAADEAAFFARHFFLFAGDGEDLTAALETLLGHPDWRVRAALAEGLRDHRSPHTATSQFVLARLVTDPDYKVRAAAALAVESANVDSASAHLAVLMTDENWYVRERVLHGLLVASIDLASSRTLVEDAMSVLSSEPSWLRCPAHLAPLVHRLLLLFGPVESSDGVRARDQALFALLREIRTGWTRYPDETENRLIRAGLASSCWLVRREAESLGADRRRDERSASKTDVPMGRERFRRLRNHRSLQVALDMHDLADALTVANAAAAADVDFIEVGDPLIKTEGLGAVEQIKRHVPHMTVVAEMMSSDWGRDQVVQAAQAGADVVLLIGPATSASVSAAVEAGRRLGVPILLDVPAAHLSQPWIADMERAGVDGFAITTNIDLGAGGRHPLTTARMIRGWTQLPVAVSGGFSTADHSIISSSDWDILIVGRSITDAVEPADAANRVADLVHKHSKGTQ